MAKINFGKRIVPQNKPPRIRELLAANNENDTARQHLAILSLSDTVPLDEVYQAVTDITSARERALDSIESGDLDQLGLILAAAPRIATEGITGAFVQAVIALANGDYDAAHQIAALIAERGTASQREAFAIRLRAFAITGRIRPMHKPPPILSPAAILQSSKEWLNLIRFTEGFATRMEGW